MDELKEALKESNLTLGTDRTLKKLRDGSVKKIFIANNCAESVKKNLKHYGKLLDVKVVELDASAEDIGAACKKPFMISVLSC